MMTRKKKVVHFRDVAGSLGYFCLLAGCTSLFAQGSDQRVYMSSNAQAIPTFSNDPVRQDDRLIMRFGEREDRNRYADKVAAYSPTPRRVAQPRGQSSLVTASVLTWRRNRQIEVEAPRASPVITSSRHDVSRVSKHVERSVGRTVSTAPVLPSASDLQLVRTQPSLSSLRPNARLAEFDAAITSASKMYNIEEAFIRAVIHVESGFNPVAVSHKGAAGLMQLMPATARRFGVTNAKDPIQNIHGGANYLRELLNLFSGDQKLALAAYNAGEGAVLKYNRRVPPYNETQHYVRAVMARYQELRR